MKVTVEYFDGYDTKTYRVKTEVNNEVDAIKQAQKIEKDGFVMETTKSIIFVPASQVINITVHREVKKTVAKKKK